MRMKYDFHKQRSTTSTADEVVLRFLFISVSKVQKCFHKYISQIALAC